MPARGSFISFSCGNGAHVWFALTLLPTQCQISIALAAGHTLWFETLVPQVIIWGTRTWKLMVQTHSCQPGLRVWLSQKGIQGKQSASKYKLRVGDFFLLPYGFLRGRSEGKVKSGSSWWDKPSVPQDVLEFWSNYFVPSAVLLQDWALCQGEIAQRLKHTLTGTRDQVIC